MNEATKKNRKKIIVIICIAIGALLIGLAVFLIIIMNSNKHKIVGTWKKGNSYTEFTKDGEMIDALFKTKIGTYTIDGDTLIMSWTTKIMNVDLGENKKQYRILKLTSETLQLETIDNKKSISVYTKQSPSQEERDYLDNADKRKAANEIAQIAYSKIYDISTKGLESRIIETSGVVSVDLLKSSNSSTLQQVYEAIKSSNKLGGDNLGYIYIYYNIDDVKFVQWSEKESGATIGQYPEAFSMNVKFGTKA